MTLPSLARSAFALLLVTGCGAAADPTPPPGKTTGTGHSVAVTDPTLTTMPGASPATCTEIHNQAQMDLEPAFAAAAMGCTVDDDCQIGSAGNHCDDGCGALVSRSGAPLLASALAEQDQAICAQYLADGCTTAVHGCFAVPGSRTPQCIAGACVPGIPAAWDSFSLQIDTSAFGAREVPTQLGDPLTPCVDAGCTTWTVNSLGQVETMTWTSTTMAVLSQDDLATLDQALRDPALRQALTTQESAGEDAPLYECPSTGTPPFTPAEHAVALIDRTDTGSSVQGDVSACLESYAASNVFGSLYTLLQKY